MSDIHANRSPASKEIDPEQLTKLLEIELMHKRTEWKQAGARNRSRRAASFAFLFILLLACAVGGFLMFSKLNEKRANQAVAPEPVSAGQ